VDRDDQRLWPPFYLAEGPGREAREERIHEHVNRHRERGAPPPRRARSLSRGEIVRAAVTVADADGPEAISMRRIARELDAGAMSLYWHISSKEELLDLMVDAVQGEMQPPEPSGDWRADLEVIARIQRATLHRHRWVMDFMGGRPPMGPNSLRTAERGLAALDPLSLGNEVAIRFLMAVTTYVMGAVLRELQEERAEHDRTSGLDGLTEDEVEQKIGEYVGWLRTSGEYPHLIGMFEARIDPDAHETRDARFEFGLACLLDGIAARIPGQPGSPGASALPGPAGPPAPPP
jgi:AcrR family transcriptional regulator